MMPGELFSTLTRKLTTFQKSDKNTRMRILLVECSYTLLTPYIAGSLGMGLTFPRSCKAKNLRCIYFKILDLLHGLHLYIVGPHIITREII